MATLEGRELAYQLIKNGGKRGDFLFLSWWEVEAYILVKSEDPERFEIFLDAFYNYVKYQP